MSRFVTILQSPGIKSEVRGIASTQRAARSSDKDLAAVTVGYQSQAKTKGLDRWLDKTVQASGSEFVFLAILAALLTWAFLGIKFGLTTNWQVIISDVQAIFSYIFDSFLMRQQLNSYDESLLVIAEIRSRTLSELRMLNTLARRGITSETVPQAAISVVEYDMNPKLPIETWLGRLSTVVSLFLGHVITVCGFWIAVVVWIAIGPLYGWSDAWQLYMNSASSALMVLIFAFLANIRETHKRHTEKCLAAIHQVDCSLESKLRGLTGDELANEEVVITPPKPNVIQRAIDYYADVVGTLVGIALLIIVLGAWIAIGPVMHFDSNWWLLIGSYAGLIEMNDGFILRNIDENLKSFEDQLFAELEVTESTMFGTVLLGPPEKTEPEVSSLSHRVFTAIARVCAHELTVVFGVMLIVGLIVGASVMRWSFTGQLLCNVPPSIIESFLMIILITGHNISEARRRADLDNIYSRRSKLLAFARACESTSSWPKHGTCLF